MIGIHILRDGFVGQVDDRTIAAQGFHMGWPLVDQFNVEAGTYEVDPDDRAIGTGSEDGDLLVHADLLPRRGISRSASDRC